MKLAAIVDPDEGGEECWAATQQAAASGIVVQGDGSPLSPSTGIECVNCICIGNTANGIWIQGGTQIGIVGGACIGNHGAGIRANDASRIRIVGVRSAPDSDFPLQSFGTVLGTGLSGVVVQGCDRVDVLDRHDDRAARAVDRDEICAGDRRRVAHRPLIAISRCRSRESRAPGRSRLASRCAIAVRRGPRDRCVRYARP